MMTKDFSQAMSEQTDKQLVDIVTFKRDDYQPDAIAAAENELSIRQIDPAEFYTGKEGSVLSQAAEPYHQDLPLEKVQILLTVLLPAIFITAWIFLCQALEDLKFLSRLGFPAIVFTYYLIHKRLKDKGYLKKAKAFITWTVYTLFIYTGLLLIVGLSVYMFS